ncbi:integrase, catalytic region, zinc finger, CCHC-type containing protein [Tanacetum coccineum]
MLAGVPAIPAVLSPVPVKWSPVLVVTASMSKSAKAAPVRYDQMSVMPQSLPASYGLPVASLKSQSDSYSQLPATVKSLPADPSLQNPNGRIGLAGGDAGNTDAGGDAGSGGDGICGNGDDSGVSGDGGGFGSRHRQSRPELGAPPPPPPSIVPSDHRHHLLKVILLPLHHHLTYQLVGEAAAGSGCSSVGSISSSSGMYSGYIGSGTKSSGVVTAAPRGQAHSQAMVEPDKQPLCKIMGPLGIMGGHSDSGGPMSDLLKWTGHCRVGDRGNLRIDIILTPIDTEKKLGPEGSPVTDPTLYRSLVGSLQYLTFTRPDLSYAVQQLCLYMHDPREPHLNAMKRVLRCCPATRQSTSGYCVFLGDNLLTWSSKRQDTLSRSSAGAEYRGVANAVAETSWIRNLLRELHTPFFTSTLVYCDNVSAGQSRNIDVNKVLHLKKQISNHMEGETLAWSKDEQSRLDGLSKYSIQLLSYDDTSRISVLFDKLIKKFNQKIAKCKKHIEKAIQQSKDLENQNKDLQDKYDVLKNQVNTFEEKINEFNEQIKLLNEKNDDLLAQMEVLQKQLKVKHVMIDTHTECQLQYAKLEEERYQYMIRYSTLCDNDKQHRKKIDEQEILFDKMHASFDVNDLFFFNDVSIRNSRVSKMPFRKKPHDSLNMHSKSNSNNSLPRTLFRWLSKMQPLVEPVAKWIPKICLWLINSGCSKHMTGNCALLINFVEKFLGTVRFSNNDFSVIAGYGDVVIGSMTIKKVYYVEGLGHNLFSVGQFFDKDLEVTFRKSTCFVRNEYGVDLLTGNRASNLYTITLNEIVLNPSACLLAKGSSSQSWLWRQRKIHRKHHKSKMALASNKPLYLLHMDLCGPMRVESINGKRYLLVVVDDYSRTPQQNRVVERRNRTLVETERTMLTFANLPLVLWAEAIATTCFTQNRSIIHKCFDKTPYELINMRKPNIKFFRVFSYRCYLLNDYDYVGKLNVKGDIRVFVGYSKEYAAFMICIHDLQLSELERYATRA